MKRTLNFFHQASLNRFDGHPYAPRPPIGGLDANTLQVGSEFALRDARHVRADAAALLGLTLPVDDRALDGTSTGDCTDSGHDGFELVKGSGVKAAIGAKQGQF